MPVPKSEFEDLRPLTFRDPEEVLDPDEMYTVYEIARLFQGLDPGQDLDPTTENILLDWTIPWVLDNAESFVFAEPADDAEPGHYGLATGDAGGDESGSTADE
ncbi:DUF5827 family protein [Halorientalis halophila]|uniref:DUF5827 family protein n=1 Tax=Halorientalis halophila TaxID=3108499 RepID=UPI003008F99F